MLELFADWEPLPSVASIRAASRVTEPSSATVRWLAGPRCVISYELAPWCIPAQVQVVELGTACSQKQQQEPSDQLAPSDTVAAEPTGQRLTPAEAAAAPLAQGVRQLIPPAELLAATGSQFRLKQQCSEREDQAAVVEQLTSPSGAVTHAIVEPAEAPEQKHQLDELVSSQPTPEQGSASEEEGELPEDGELAEPETKKKRQRGERAGKRVKQRIAKRAREREQQQLQLEAGLSPQLVTPNKAHRKDKPTCK